MSTKQEEIGEQVKTYNSNYKNALEKTRMSARRMVAARGLRQRRDTGSVSISGSIVPFTKEERIAVQKFYKAFCDSISQGETLSKRLVEIEKEKISQEISEKTQHCKDVLQALDEIGWPEEKLKLSVLLLGEKSQQVMDSQSKILAGKEEELKKKPIKNNCVLFIPSKRKCLSEEEGLERDKANFEKALELKIMLKLLQEMGQFPPKNN